MVMCTLFVVLGESSKFTEALTHFIINLHFYYSLANTRHSGPQINTQTFIFQPSAAFLRANKVTEIFPLAHMVVQFFIACAGFLKHAQSKLVVVQVVVVRHGEHDSDAFGASLGVSVVKVVGQQAVST